jgi:hypothetical protein
VLKFTKAYIKGCIGNIKGYLLFITDYRSKADNCVDKIVILWLRACFPSGHQPGSYDPGIPVICSSIIIDIFGNDPSNTDQDTFFIGNQSRSVGRRWIILWGQSNHGFHIKPENRIIDSRIMTFFIKCSYYINVFFMQTYSQTNDFLFSACLY